MGEVSEIERLTAERDEARAWVRRMTAETRVLTCAFCGEAYPPGTPETNHDALTAHVMLCTKHPLAARIRELEQTADVMLRIEDEIRRLHGSAGYPLDGILSNIEGCAEEGRNPESEDEDGHEERLSNLLSLAAFAVMALRYETAHPGLDLETVAEP